MITTLELRDLHITVRSDEERTSKTYAIYTATYDRLLERDGAAVFGHSFPELDDLVMEVASDLRQNKRRLGMVTYSIEHAASGGDVGDIKNRLHGMGEMLRLLIQERSASAAYHQENVLQM